MSWDQVSVVWGMTSMSSQWKSATVVLTILLMGMTAQAHTFDLRWRPLYVLNRMSPQVIRGQVVEYGPVKHHWPTPDGSPALFDPAQKDRYPVYEWMKVRVLASLKADCLHDTLTLDSGNWTQLSDSVMESKYTLGEEYILMLPHCDRTGRLGNPFCKFEYDDGMVTGRIKSVEIETVPIAEFLLLLEEPLEK
jgi:hypothetical protein